MPAASWRSACWCAKRCDYVNQREQNTTTFTEQLHRQLAKEPRRVCARRRKESPITFFAAHVAEENTSRPANVRAVRLRWAARALQSGRKLLCQKRNTFLTVSRGGKPPSDGILAIFMSPHLCGDIKIAPCSNIRTRGYPAVFGSITLEPPLVFLPRTGTGRRTRTPTAVKGNAHSRFHTTACRLRNYRTLSASGRFSTSDSPPRLPLNLYCKSAAPCGVATLPLCIFSIAAASRFVNVLINKNT